MYLHLLDYNVLDINRKYFFIVRELSEEEKMMIVLSKDFQNFMDRCGRIMERALSENIDIYTDYTGISNSDERR